MSDHDFQIDMVRRFFEAVVKHDSTVSRGSYADMYAQPGYVDIKIGFYISYELTALRADAVARATKNSTTPEPQTRTIANKSAKVKMKIPGSSATYEVPMKYAVTYANLTLKPLDEVGPPFSFDWDDYFEKAKKATDLYFHLTVTRTLGDAVNDTGKELARCGFVYHADLTRMSETGRRAYSKNLKDIDFVPADAAPDQPILVDATKDTPAYYEDKGVMFKKALAVSCTYDSTGAYHGKWNPEAIEKPHRPYTRSNLSVVYLTRTTKEYELEQGSYYALLTSPKLQRLYRLTETKKGDRLDLLVNLNESTVIPPTDEEFEELPRPEFIIFKAQHGLKRGGKGVKLPTFSHPTTGAMPWRLADPQREVEGEIGKTAAAATKARSDFDWFVELVKLRFTESMYMLDITKFLDDARTDKDLLFLPEYRTQARDALANDLWNDWAKDNPIRLEYLNKLRPTLEDPTKLVIARGVMISDTVKFIGLDKDFAWARDIKNNVTLKMPHAAFLARMSVIATGKLLHKNSEGVIYFSMIVVWGGLAVMGAALIPGALALRTIYRVVANRVRGAIAHKAIKDVMITEIPAMAALLAEIIAGLIADHTGNKDAKLWKAFAAGFFKGYAKNTLKKVFLNIDEDLAKAVLKEWYLYKRIKALHQTVKKLATKYEELSAKLDRKHTEALIKKFEKAAEPAVPIVLVLFQLISFLEHGDAEDLVVGISGALGETHAIEKLEKEQWYKEAKEMVIGGVEAIGTFLTVTGKDAFKKIDGVFEFVERHEKELGFVALAFAAKNLLKAMGELKGSPNTKASPKKIIIIVAGLLAGGVVADQLTDGHSTEVIASVGNYVQKSIPGKSETDAKLRGEIYGTALGALFFDHGLVGSQSSIGRLAKHDKTAKRIRKKLKAGIFMPILTLIFERYVIFFRKTLGHDGDNGDIKDLLKDLSHWRTDQKGLEFLDDYRTETTTDIREIMASVLNIKRFLDGEVRDRWKAKWGPRLESYEEDLGRFRSDAQTLGIEELVKAHAPVVGYTLLTQLRSVMQNIEAVFKAMAEEIDVPFEGASKLSLLRFIEMLGFDLGQIDGLALEFDTEFAELGKDFKK